MKKNQNEERVAEWSVCVVMESFQFVQDGGLASCTKPKDKTARLAVLE
jgi:hypothetical protein